MNIRYPIYEGVYRILTVKHAISNFRGQYADRLHRQGFRGKYRSRARMIFPETCKARPCRWQRAVPLPLPRNWNDGIIYLSRPWILGKKVSG